MKTFDPTKPVRLRTSTHLSPVRILCTDGPGDKPIVGICGTTLYQWRSDGIFYNNGVEGGSDLVNYDPFEITDEEAELIIDLWWWRHERKVDDPSNAYVNGKVRNREFEKIGGVLRLRDLIIKHRKTK